MNAQNQNILFIFSLVFVLFMVSFGVGESRLAQAGESLRDRAVSGDVTAQFAYGEYYRNTAQSLEDFGKAFFWTKKAAEQGMGKAQVFVADMYCSGSGVAQSYIYAYAWHYLAAQNGVSAAEEKMETLGQLFLTPDDIQEALNIVRRLEVRSKE
jgi:TPR repeat protein